MCSKPDVVDLDQSLSYKHPMSTKPSPIPSGHATATPYLTVKDSTQAIAFYQKAFGAVDRGYRIVAPNGMTAHAEIQIGNSVIMLADEAPDHGTASPLSLGGSPVRIALYVEDSDAVAQSAVAAGAKLIIPVADQFYGHRSGRIEDPFGHVWIISTQIEEVSPEEMQRRATKLFG